jgi:hypothetical protein
LGIGKLETEELGYKNFSNRGGFATTARQLTTIRSPCEVPSVRRFVGTPLPLITLGLSLLGVFLLSMTGCGGGSSNTNFQQQQVTVSIASAPTTIGVGANWTYTATVAGTSNQAVTWSASAGTIDANSGLFIAPNTVPSSPTVTITATSSAATSATATATITVQANDPLGTATGSSFTCPTFAGGLPADQSTCYQVNITCDGIADFSAYVKVNQPSGTPLGTVILGTGTGGSALYDYDSPDFFNGSTNGGLAVVNGLLNNGFTTAQVTFGAPFNTSATNGWLQGPGGVRRLACRYATLAQWISTNIPTSANTPLCATGNSGGAGAIGYALTEYGLDSIFAMVETTSGPPMSRLDEACVQPSQCQDTTFTCNSGDQPETIHMCYATSESEIIDPAYSTPVCTNAVNGTSTPPAGLLLSDSILGGPTPDFPSTYVNLVIGGQDTSSAPDQALTWEQAITSTAEKNQGCVSDAPHALPSVEDGAQRIVTDLTNHCILLSKSAAK